MEPLPPLPSASLDLSRTVCGDDSADQVSMTDSILSHVSRMLMKDDTADNILHSDHPALLKVQRPFAQILFSHSFGTSNDEKQTYASVPLHVADSGDHRKENSELSAVDAFFRGMEEASKLLPEYGREEPSRLFPICSDFRRDDLLVDKLLKRRYNRVEHLEEDEVVVVRKTARMMKEMEEIREIFDDLMLHSYEACARDMAKLRTDVHKDKVHSRSNKATMYCVDLRSLLTLCAQAVAAGNQVRAGELLKQIKQHASAKGDATQRLAKCFAEGLEARLAGTGCQMYKCPSVGEFLKAYKLFMAASGFYKVALEFNIITILHAMEGKNRLHIVEFGTIFGLQWSYLLHDLANREGGPPEVRITTIDRTQRRSLPAERIEETGCRLSNCAREFGLPFKFHYITAAWETVGFKDLNTNDDEVLVVNDLFNLSTLMDETIFVDKPSPKQMVLSNIRKMSPDVFIQSIVNCSSGTSFLTRFREALFYFTALFDMLDVTVPRESGSRSVLEEGFLGRCALNIIACEGEDLLDRPEKYRQWHVRNKRAGLRQLPLKSNVVQLVRDKVMKFYHEDFFIEEDDQWLIHGWMGRALSAHSTWVANDAPFSK